MLDGVQFGCMISRTAKLHPDGGHVDALAGAAARRCRTLEAVEAKKTAAGKDFGELVRERRRQRGLPLPIAEKVLPFLPKPSSDATSDDPPLPTAMTYRWRTIHSGFAWS